jgi:hypothetical protein
MENGAEDFELVAVATARVVQKLDARMVMLRSPLPFDETARAALYIRALQVHWLEDGAYSQGRCAATAS